MAIECGVGLRPTHYSHVLEHLPRDVDFFEIISENYMYSEGRPREWLTRIREHYPIHAHGVSMSIFSSEGVNIPYLQKLRDFADAFEPRLVSDHACWTGADRDNAHDLLPFPMTKEFLELGLANIGRAQDIIKRPLAFENLSAYLAFESSTFQEWDFLVELCRRSGCRLLLDLNNLWVNGQNLGFDPAHFVAAIPSELIAQLHLGGPTDDGRFLFDTHSTAVPEPVFALLERFAAKLHSVPLIVERDGDIPTFEALAAECARARRILAAGASC